MVQCTDLQDGERHRDGEQLSRSAQDEGVQLGKRGAAGGAVCGKERDGLRACDVERIAFGCVFGGLGGGAWHG